MTLERIVYVIDDDPAIGASLSILLKSAGLRQRTFPSAEAFLTTLKDKATVCALVDFGLPGMNGLELQQHLADRDIDAALVILTGQADVPLAVKAMRAGALHFIEKPFDPEILLEAINDALSHQSELKAQRARRDDAEASLQRLTPREREILALLVEGHLNKVIAARLGISTRTVEHHRSHIMAKTKARTVSAMTPATFCISAASLEIFLLRLAMDRVPSKVRSSDWILQSLAQVEPTKLRVAGE